MLRLRIVVAVVAALVVFSPIRASATPVDVLLFYVGAPRSDYLAFIELHSANGFVVTPWSSPLPQGINIDANIAVRQSGSINGAFYDVSVSTVGTTADPAASLAGITAQATIDYTVSYIYIDYTDPLFSKFLGTVTLGPFFQTSQLALSGSLGVNSGPQDALLQTTLVGRNGPVVFNDDPTFRLLFGGPLVAGGQYHVTGLSSTGFGTQPQFPFPQPVPEPASITLLASGVAALLFGGIVGTSRNRLKR